MNLNMAALAVLEYEDISARLVGPSRITTLVQSSSFEANERGLSFGGKLGAISVVDCTFAGNAVMHAGAGLLIYVDPSNPPINVTGSRFVDNAAGSVDMDAFAADADSFKVRDNEVRTALQHI